MRTRTLAAIRNEVVENPETLAFAITLGQSIQLEFDRNKRGAIRRAINAQNAAAASRAMKGGR